MLKTRAYRFEVQVIDVGPEMPNIVDVIHELERSKWLSIRVKELLDEVEFEWDDSHPLNHKMTYEEYKQWWKDNSKNKSSSS